MPFEVTVNGRPVVVERGGDEPLIFLLRDTLALRGSRYGCGEEQCGACMVLVDDVPAFSCTRTLDSVAGRAVTTVEGLSQDGALGALQRAFLDVQAGQCGYCLSGILMSAHGLLLRNPDPTRSDVIAALEPHICRCGMHNRIVAAILLAATVRRGTVGVPA